MRTADMAKPLRTLGDERLGTEAVTPLEPTGTQHRAATTTGDAGTETVFAGPLKVVRLEGALGHRTP